jgi:hypothetical protein
MEQAAELAFVDHRDSRREPPKTGNPLASSNHSGPSLPAEARPAAVRGEPDLRRTRNSAPVSPQRGGSLTALQPRSMLSGSDALSLREFGRLSIIGAFVLLSPVLALLAAIAVEIAIDILLQAGGSAIPVFVAAGAIGWVLRRMLWRGRGEAPVEA